MDYSHLSSKKEAPLRRLTRHIGKLFEEYLKNHPQSDYKEHNAVLDVRNLIYQSIEAFFNEPAIQKKYGVPIDSTSLISFNHNDELVNLRSSWIPFPSNEDETRPSGLTNEEYKEFSDRLDKLFVDGNMYPSTLHNHVMSLFMDAFLKPAINRPFKAGTYVRFGISGFVRDQAVPCEICGESRTIDLCHIIPRRLRGSDGINNILFLCSTHHRLFDTCMLSKEEWDKIDWSRKSKKSQIYAEKVIKVAHCQFWDKVDAGIYKKQTTEELDVYYIRRLHKENAKDIDEAT